MRWRGGEIRLGEKEAGLQSSIATLQPKIRPFKWNKMMMDTSKGVIINHNY